MNAFLTFLEKLLTVIFSVSFGILILIGLVRCADTSSEEADYWRQVRKKNTIEGYQGYLRRCPACPHEALARKRVDELLSEGGLVARLDDRHMPERVSIGLPTFSADGLTILASGASGPSLWDADTGRHLSRAGYGFVMEDPRSLEALAYSPDGSRIAAGTRGSERGRLLLWDVKTGAILAERVVEERDVIAVQFAPEGPLLGWLAQGPLGLWDPAGGKFLRAVQEGSRALAFYRNEQGRYWLLTASGREVWSWAPGSLELVRQVRIDSDRELLGFSQDGRLIAYTQGSVVELWDTRSAEPVATFKDHDGDVLSFCRDPRKGRIVVGTRTGTLYLWNPMSKVLLGKIPAHDGPVERLACSIRGQSVSTSWDGGKIWNLDKLDNSKLSIEKRTQ